MSEHAVLAPSSASIWGHCSGYPLASKRFPDISGPEAEIGTAVHWVISETLSSSGSVEQLLGNIAPNGIRITEDMIEGAQVMVEDVRRITPNRQLMLIEHRVKMPAIHEQNWGTLDAAVWLKGIGRLYIWDYKNGHRENSAKENLQLINYVAGLIEELQIDALAEQHINVHMRIVQPFSYKSDGPLDEWVVKMSELRPFFNQLHGQAHEALGPNPTLTPGIWCRDCPAVGVCSAVKKASYSIIDYVKQPYTLDEMNSPDLATERKILQVGENLVTARLDAIEDELHHRIKSGSGSESGLALQSKPGNLNWTVEKTTAVSFAKQFGVDISKTDALTPVQTIAKVPKKIKTVFLEALKTVTRRSPGELKLIDANETVGVLAFKKKEN